MKPATTAYTQTLKPKRAAQCADLQDVPKQRRLKIKRATTSAATNATKANLNRQQPTRWKNGARNLKNGATKGNEEMKNWLIQVLGGVPKQTYMETAEGYEAMLSMYTKQFYKLEQENAGIKDEKAAMENAAEIVSANLSETIDRLNEERKVSNGLMAKGTALGIKVQELQDELERKDKELSQTKVQLLDVLRNKPDSALRSEIARLKGELELLKRNKFKRGRK